MQIFSKFWLVWVPFAVFVSVLAPWGILNMYWGKFHHVHAFFIGVVHCCMLSVWQNVLVTFLCWIGLKWVPLLGFTLDWPCLTCFDQWECVLKNLPKLSLNAMLCTHKASSRHTPCTSYCAHLHQHMHSTCTHMHSLLFSCIVFMFTCFNTYSMLF